MLGKLNEAEINEVLKKGTVGRIGCHYGGRTYVVPVTYVYNGSHIIAHSREGLKIQMMRANPSVCFEVEELADMTHWKSVIIWGHYEELSDEGERFEAIKQFVDSLLKHPVSATAHPEQQGSGPLHPPPPAHGRMIIYRIIPEEITGRFEDE